MKKAARNELKSRVENILRNIPESRNSDVTLTIEIWKKYYPQRIITSERTGKQAVLLTDLYDLPREDSVKRMRALFNAEGKYFPTDWRVAKQRGINEDTWREALGYPTKEETRKPTRADSYMDPQRDFIRNQGTIL